MSGGGPYTLVVEQAQQIQNFKLPPQQLRDNAERADALIPGNGDINARGTVLQFELIYSTKAGSDGGFYGLSDGTDTDDYALGLSCVNGSASKGQTEEEWFDEHFIEGLAKTIAATNLNGTGTMKDTFPVIKSGKTSYFYTNPNVDCPRNALLRARHPMSREEAQNANIKHQANPDYPENRYLLYAEPVDPRYIGFTRDSAKQLRKRYESKKVDGDYSQAFNVNSLQALSRLTTGLTQTCMLTFVLLKNKLRAAGIHDASIAAAATNVAQLLDFLSKADQDVVMLVQDVCAMVISPHLKDFEGMDETDKMIARNNMNGVVVLANTFTEWRWRSMRTIFARSLTPAKAASGRPLDVMVIQNAY